jgi:glyoxylase-like metal-dependent hydrolase (beta-lactamase superfamily II)
MMSRASDLASAAGRRARRLFALFCGFEVCDIGVSLRGLSGQMLAEPMGVFAVETDRGYVLIDSGANEETLWDPELCPRHYFAFPHPVIRPQDTLANRLAEIGVSPAAVTDVVVTHLHSDHAGGIRLFPQANIVVQRPEYERAMAQDNPYRPYFRSDWDRPTTRWKVIEGDVEIAPGVTALAAYGHTPGHQAALVELPHTGSVLIPGDAGDLFRNFEEQIPPGGTTDLEAAVASLRRLTALWRERDALLFPGHDLEAWRRYKQSPDSYD